MTFTKQIIPGDASQYNKKRKRKQGGRGREWVGISDQTRRERTWRQRMLNVKV